jgi:translocation and assembly module TamB
MPLDDHRDSSREPEPGRAPRPSRARRRLITRRNAVISVIGLACALLALILVAMFTYRLGYVDRYIAGQVKDTLSKYGIRAEIRSFHTSLTPQTVELLGLELYDAKTGEKLGKIDRMLATVRIEDLYALNLRRNINLKDLQIEGLELWVTFDAEGRSNFRNIQVPPPAPNQRILFAYSTAHLEIKNSQIHYGDALHSLSGEARNLHATIQPDDPMQPAASLMNTVAFSSTNSTFVYDGRPINNIDIEAHARTNETRAEIQELTLRSPFAEAKLQGVMDDWRALKYHLSITSTVDLTQASDVLQIGTAIRGAGNFTGTVVGDGDHYQLEGNIKSDALAADRLRLQGLEVNARGSGQGKSYDINGRAVARLLNAGDFQLNMVQLSGGVMGTGTDFRWLGELRAAAARGYGTTIAGLILRDARADYRDGVLTASAPRLAGTSLSSSGAKVQQGFQVTDLRVKVDKDVTTASVATAKAGKIQSGETTVNGVTAKAIDIKNAGTNTDITIKEVQVGEANAFGAQTGSINIAGVRLAIHNGRVQGSTSDINAGKVIVKKEGVDGQVEDVKLARPVFTVEPSGRYRASADLSLGGGVLGELKLGPAHASVVATSDQIQLNDLVAEALEGRASGNATISLKKNGASHIRADFNNFDVAGLINMKAGRAVPIASKATGKVDLTLTGTDIATATGSVNAQLSGSTTNTDLTPLSGDVSVTADHGVFQLRAASLQTPATRIIASGQFSIDQPVSNLKVEVASTDASELQRLLISSGVVPSLEEDFRRYSIDLNGKLVFNGTLSGALQDPLVNGHVELGSLTANKHDFGAITANISSTTAETRVSDGRLAQANGGVAQFSLVMPRTGKDNISIEANLDRISAAGLAALFDLSKAMGLQAELKIDTDLSGHISISGYPNAMTGVADLRLSPGKIAGEPLQSLTAHATFAGAVVNVDKIEAYFSAGHLVGNGTFNTASQAFDFKASADRILLNRLEGLANIPDMPSVFGTARLNLAASGTFKVISSYQISFDGLTNDIVVNDKPAGTLKLAGQTQNKQLDITLTSTELLGPQPQVVTAVVVLDEKLPATIESRLTGVDLTPVFKILLPPSDVLVAGRATGELKLSGNLMVENDEGEESFSVRGLTGAATFTELSVRVEDVTLSPVGNLIVEFAPNEINVHQTRFTGQGTNMTIGGAFATSPGGQNTLAVDGRVNLRLFSGVSSRDVFSSGEAELSINFGGTFEERRITGTARLITAKVSVLAGDQRLTLSNLNGVIRFAPMRQPGQIQAQIESLSGKLGGGNVHASGGALLEGFTLSRFLLNVGGENVTVDYPQDFRTTLTANLELRGDKTNQFISGTVDVHRTEYTKDVNIADLINNRPKSSIEEGDEFKFAQTANFDKLRVEGRNAVIMRNNLGNLVASAQLMLNGPVKAPIIEGRVTATRGTLNFRNNPYEVTRGLVYFPARYGADPVLSIEGQSIIRGYRVSVAIEGPLSNAQTTVSSEPSLPQADVVSLILTGTLSDADSSASVLAQSGLGTAASLLSDALINAPVSRASNKLFGLSRLEITPVVNGTTSAPTARLTVARQISKDLSVTYSTNVASDPNQVLAVEYRLSNRLSFVAEYEQGSAKKLSTRNNNYSFELRVRKRF